MSEGTDLNTAVRTPRASDRDRLRVRRSPAVAVAAIGAVLLAATGLLFSRPDVIAIGLPLALYAIVALTMRTSTATISVDAGTGTAAEVLTDVVTIDGDAEVVQLAIVQGDRIHRTVLVPGRARITSRIPVRHSGPVRAVELDGRVIGADAGALGPALPATGTTRAVPPPARPLRRLPLPSRLTGVHGAHDGSRPGQGGDFRDIHPFAPGDELRRVDWRATARAARRPGDLLVRRTDSLSDASVVIVMDTADDLGTAVATWGVRDPERSGVTSLDLAREAARSIAESTIGAGDRVSFHTLVHGGRSVRSGSGARHLARVVAEISAAGEGGDDARYRRTPPVPHGSIIYVLSTFFDGAAAQIAMSWRASGHRVVAVDVLPALDRARLEPEHALALRVLLAERVDMMHELRTAGIDIVAWRQAPSEDLAALTARSRPGGPGGGGGR